MKISKLLACTAMCSSLAATVVGAKEINMNTARMQAMDKITGKVSEIDVPVNGEVKFGSFSIVVRACAARPPEETPENFAFVDVVDDYDSDYPVNIFKGWMISSSPALNAVEHPIYDVWLLKCYDGDLNKQKILSSEELKLRDEISPLAASKDQIEVTNHFLQVPEKLKTEAGKIEEKSSEKQNEEVKSEIVEEVIPASTLEPMAVIQEDGGPKVLIPASTEASDAKFVNIEKDAAEELNVSKNDDVVEKVVEELQQIEDEPVETEETLLQQVNETQSNEVVVNPEENEAAIDNQDTSDENLTDMKLLQETDKNNSQLIKFDEEAEEDGYELNAEALTN